MGTPATSGDLRVASLECFALRLNRYHHRHARPWAALGRASTSLPRPWTWMAGTRQTCSGHPGFLCRNQDVDVEDWLSRVSSTKPSPFILACHLGGTRTVDSSDSITIGPDACSPAGMRPRSKIAASTAPVARNHTERLDLMASVPEGAGLSRIASGAMAPIAARRTLTIWTGSVRLSCP